MPSLASASANPVLPQGKGLVLPGEVVPLRWVRSPRARRYAMRLSPDGSLRLTIPRGGTVEAGWQFAQRHVAWVERALGRMRARPVAPRSWGLGTVVLFRGEPHRLEAGWEAGSVRLGGEVMRVGDGAGDLRPAVEWHLWALATRELPPRVEVLAAAESLTVGRVCVRDQRSRWGSCSRAGTISLNWRLVQAPVDVRDYIILHELMHLREMNHSARFWGHVERVCPGYREAEGWLRANAWLLR